MNFCAANFSFFRLAYLTWLPLPKPIISLSLDFYCLLRASQYNSSSIGIPRCIFLLFSDILGIKLQFWSDSIASLSLESYSLSKTGTAFLFFPWGFILGLKVYFSFLAYSSLLIFSFLALTLSTCCLWFSMNWSKFLFWGSFWDFALLIFGWKVHY